MPSESTMNASLAISALGWVIAVILFACVLFIGKPYYQNVGYEAGRLVAAEANIKAVDEAISRRPIEGDEYVVLGKLVTATSTELTIETINPYLQNPLSKDRRLQTVRIDAQTVFEKRTALSEAEFIAALEASRAQGLTTDQAILHKTEPLTVNMLKLGDEIRVYPSVAQDATKDSFYAKQVLLVLSSQAQQVPAN